jgi:hypothetical protein
LIKNDKQCYQRRASRNRFWLSNRAKIGQTPWEITHRLDVRDMKIERGDEQEELDEHKAQIRALKNR